MCGMAGGQVEILNTMAMVSFPEKVVFELVLKGFDKRKGKKSLSS